MSNQMSEKGPGEWTVVTYNPLRSIGPIKGYLRVGAGFHEIYRLLEKGNTPAQDRTIFNCSSLNVAYVTNRWFFEEQFPLNHERVDPKTLGEDPTVQPSPSGSAAVAVPKGTVPMPTE